MSIPHSNKVKELRKRIEQLTLLKKDVIKEPNNFKKNDVLYVNKSLHDLTLKEKVISYLENISQGTVITQGITPENLLKYRDIALHNEEHSDIYLSSETRTYITWFKHYFTGIENKRKALEKINRFFYLESKPPFKFEQVENLVLAGGGAKVLSLAGALSALDITPSLNIKRIAGTSGGAIMAMCYAVGYTGKELEQMVFDNAFGLFTLNSVLDNKVFNQWAHWFHRDNKNKPMHISSDNKIAHQYHNALVDNLIITIRQHDNPILSPLKKLLTNVDKRQRSLSTIQRRKKLRHAFSYWANNAKSKEGVFNGLLSVLGDDAIIAIDAHAQRNLFEHLKYKQTAQTLYKSPKIALLNAVRHKTGSDIILAFFSDLLVDKLKKIPHDLLRTCFFGEKNKHNLTCIITEELIRNITFSQFEKLRTLKPDTFLQLNISICVERPFLERFKQGNYIHWDVEYVNADNPALKNMSIAESVRVSMNLPGVYSGYKFMVDNISYTGVDGGILSNVSMGVFDEVQPEHNTVGIFYKTADELLRTQNVDRLLSVTRKGHNLLTEIAMREKIINESELALDKLDTLLVKSDNPTVDYLIMAKRYNKLKNRMFSNSGQLDNLKEEYLQGHKNIFNRIKDNLSSPTEAFTLYLDRKSEDILASSSNLKRMIMIKTDNVNTLDFKLNHRDKHSQIKAGFDAMSLFLKQGYSLENELHKQKINDIYRSFYSVKTDLFVNKNKSPLETKEPKCIRRFK